MESWHLPPSQGLKSCLMALFWVLSEVVGLLRRLDPIPYLVKRQDTAVARTTFYKVAGLKSLANHWLRLYHTHKVWCGGVDESLIECGKAQCQGHVKRERSDPEWSGITLEWKGVDNKSGGTTLASARALCLNLLSRVWLHISGGLNCCQESRRGVV